MPRLYSARQLVKALRKAGFQTVSQRGSHLKLRGIWKGKLRTAIIPMHKEVAFGTFRSILNQAGMQLEEFKKYAKS